MNHLVKLFNRISIKSKLIIIMIICLFLPMVITDGFLIRTMVKEVREENILEMQNAADAVGYIVDDYVNSCYVFLENLASKRNVNVFANTAYTSDLEFFENYYPISKNTVFSDDRFTATVYSGSKGTISGGFFQQISKAEGQEWYQQFCNFDSVSKGKFLYVGFEKLNWKENRSIALVSRLNLYDDFLADVSPKIIRVDINYSKVMSAIKNANYSYTLYICKDNSIIFSNDDRGGANTTFLPLTDDIVDNAGVHTILNEFGTTFDIYVMAGENTIVRAVRDNLLFILVLLSLNVLIPVFVTILINKSFSDRLIKLSRFFDSSSQDSLETIGDIDGTDEISNLMNAYNGMADRINLLIDSEYKERLKRQEVDIARQRAELTALHAQINPHFLFNALESIRMHSFVKKENETAKMVESLAVIQRQIVEWGNDLVEIKDEINFVEAYLELEKYRFGNRLMYEIAADEECGKLKVPKLSLVTFVENACIHGMEKKTSACWIFVRVSLENNYLVLEVEDTGNGFTEEIRRRIVSDIENVDMEMLRDRKNVGILNAALRLKMASKDMVRFELESESGVGTMVSIKIPLEFCQ